MSHRREAAILTLAAALVLGWLLRGREDVGLPIDETYYLFAGDRYVEWLFAPGAPGAEARRELRDRAWGHVHEHPPLAILSYGLAARLLGSWLGRPGACRAVSALLFTALFVALYLAGRRMWGRLAGAGAAAALLASPRLVGHALISALDLPAALACFLAGLAFLHARPGRLRALLFGVVLGLAFLTKLNALLLPLPFLLWGELYRPRECQQAYAAMALVSPLVMVLGWPWLWRDPAARILDYLAFHFHKTKWPTLYFGVRYQDPEAPWHYPFVYTAITLSAPVLLLIALGGARLLRGRLRDEQAVFALLMALTPILAVARPGQAKYDGERTFLSAFPWLFLLAGLGFSWAAQWLRARSGRLAPAALLLACFLPGAVAGIRQHPYELNWFSSIIGGMRGALRAGFESSSWGAHIAGREVRDWLDANLPRDATLESNAGSFATLRYYQSVGLLRTDFRFGDGSRYWVLEVCQAYASGEWWYELYEDRSPGWKRIHSFVKNGVPLCNVFERRAAPP